MDIQVLGPIQGSADERAVRLGGPKHLAMLAVLLLSSGRVVSRERLLELIWDGQPPVTAIHSLEVYVSDLRRVLKRLDTECTIRSEPPGYAISVRDEAIDLRRFEQLAREGRRALERGDAQSAALLLREALELWRGPAFGGVATNRFLEGERARLEAERLDVVEDRVEAEMRLGQHARLIGELEGLVAENPFRERLCGQLMLALYRAGRQAESSSAYQAVRVRLADELGMDPGPYLQDLLVKILRQDPSLEVQRRLGAEPESLPVTNLPTPLTSFVGRKEAVDRIGQLLARSRVVTLVGPGGIGKTRLALEVGRGLLERYPDGVWLTELAGLTDGGLIPEAIRVTLRVSEARSKSPIEAVTTYLQQRCLLIVLDNCEHIVEAAAHVVEKLAARCPKVAFLVTSRERLRIAGEQLWQVEPLTVPEATSSGPNDNVAESEAVQLFLDRAALSRSSFGLTAANSRAISEISRRLEGIPLALELAAAQVATMSTDEIERRLDDPFQLLTSGHRTASHRHQTLMAAAQWSYDLLAENQRLVFDRLSVFRGFDVEAAATICSMSINERGVCIALTLGLVDKSLVRFEGGRYRLLEPLRSFASEKLRSRGETALVQERHCRYFLAVARDRQPGELADWLKRMEAERDNLRSALGWAQDNDQELAAQIVLALDLWWRLRSHGGEAHPHLDALLQNREAQDATRVRLLMNKGWYSWYAVSAPEAAVEPMESALALARTLDDPLALIDALFVRGRYATHEGDPVQARLLLEEALELARSRGDQEREAEALHLLGVADGAQLQLGRARSELEQSLEIRRSLNRSDEAAVTLQFLSGIVGAAGELDRARRLVAEALELGRQLGEHAYLHHALDIAAGLAILEGDAQRGLTLVGAADAALERIGWSPTSVWDRLLEPYFQIGREALGSRDSAAAEQEGRRMNYVEAVEYGLAWLSTGT